MYFAMYSMELSYDFFKWRNGKYRRLIVEHLVKTSFAKVKSEPLNVKGLMECISLHWALCIRLHLIKIMYLTDILYFILRILIVIKIAIVSIQELATNSLWNYCNCRISSLQNLYHIIFLNLWSNHWLFLPVLKRDSQ